MPQMAPLNWLTLFIFFVMVFLMFNSMTYFIFLYTPLKNKINLKISQINWKW